MADQLAAIVDAFLAEWRDRAPSAAAVRDLVEGLQAADPPSAALARIAASAERYRDSELVRALSLWRAGAVAAPVAAPPAETPRAVRVAGALITAAALALAAQHVRWPEAPRALTIPASARSAPLAEPVDADGVVFAPEQAARALIWVNTASERELKGAKIPAAARAAIAAGRPFPDLGAVADAKGVGPATMRAIAAASSAP